MHMWKHWLQTLSWQLDWVYTWSTLGLHLVYTVQSHYLPVPTNQITYGCASMRSGLSTNTKQPKRVHAAKNRLHVLWKQNCSTVCWSTQHDSENIVQTHTGCEYTNLACVHLPNRFPIAVNVYVCSVCFGAPAPGMHHITNSAHHGHAYHDYSIMWII